MSAVTQNLPNETQWLKIPADLIEEAIAKKGYAEIKMFGASMNPILSEGEKATVQLITDQKINVGDIVCFKLDSHFVTHRVVKIKAPYVTTKGDNAPVLDESILLNKITARVTAIENCSIPLQNRSGSSIQCPHR